MSGVANSPESRISWKSLPSMSQLTETTECSCAEYVGNYLYVAAKKANDLVNYRYDTAILGKLSPSSKPFFLLESC